MNMTWVMTIGKRGVKYYYDDLQWDSKLEIEHYKILKEHKHLEIIELQKKFILMEGFHYIDFPNLKKRKYRDMVYTPDFILKIKGIDKLVALESKGYPRKDYNIRKKLFIMTHGDKYYHWQLQSKKQLLKELNDIFKEN